jgi:hypothetical protein
VAETTNYALHVGSREFGVYAGINEHHQNVRHAVSDALLSAGLSCGRVCMVYHGPSDCWWSIIEEVSYALEAAMRTDARVTFIVPPSIARHVAEACRTFLGDVRHREWCVSQRVIIHCISNDTGVPL